MLINGVHKGIRMKNQGLCMKNVNYSRKKKAQPEYPYCLALPPSTLRLPWWGSEILPPGVSGEVDQKFFEGFAALLPQEITVHGIYRCSVRRRTAL